MVRSIRPNYLFAAGGLTLVLLFMCPLSSKAVTSQGVNDFNQTPFYAEKTFNASHQDARNSDFVPYIMPSRYKTKWSALQRTNPDLIGNHQGTATFFGPSQGIDGGLFQNDSRGNGFSALHKIDPLTGESIAAVPPWQSDCLTVVDCAGEDPSTLDVFAASQAPLVDIDGNVYIGDLDQFWSYDKDLNVRWVVSFADIYEGSPAPFVSAFLTNDGLVGGISTDCKIALFDRDTGELAVPVFEDTNCKYVDPDINPKALTLSFLWYVDGEVSFPFRQAILKGLFGAGAANTNTPAVSPTLFTSDPAGRIFYVVSLAEPDVCSGTAFEGEDCGYLAGFDLIPDGNGGREIKQVFQTVIGPNSGASVALNQESTILYTIDGDNRIWSVNTGNGKYIIEGVDGGQGAASPTIGEDDNLYLAGGSVMNSFSPDGKNRWNGGVNYDDTVAAQLLPELEDWVVDGVVLASGKPIAKAINVVSKSLNKVWVNLSLGYEYTFLSDLQESLGLPPTPFLLQHKGVLVALDPDTGNLLEGSSQYPFVEFKGGNQGLIELSPDGSIYISKADILVSPAYYVFNELLPDRFDVTEQPLGGITAFEPENYCDFAGEGMDGVRNLIEQAISILPGGSSMELQTAFNLVRWGRGQLGFTQKTLLDAVDRQQMTREQAMKAIALLKEAETGPMTEAYNHLLQEPDPGKEDQQRARNALVKTDKLVTEAEKQIQCENR